MALNNLQGLIYHETTTKPNHINLIYMYNKFFVLNNQQELHKPKNSTKQKANQS